MAQLTNYAIYSRTALAAVFALALSTVSCKKEEPAPEPAPRYTKGMTWVYVDELEGDTIEKKVVESAIGSFRISTKIINSPQPASYELMAERADGIYTMEINRPKVINGPEDIIDPITRQKTDFKGLHFPETPGLEWESGIDIMDYNTNTIEVVKVKASYIKEESVTAGGQQFACIVKQYFDFEKGVRIREFIAKDNLALVKREEVPVGELDAKPAIMRLIKFVQK